MNEPTIPPSLAPPKRGFWFRACLGLPLIAGIIFGGAKIYEKYFPSADPYLGYRGIIDDQAKIEHEIKILTGGEFRENQWIDKYSTKEREIASEKIKVIGYKIDKNGRNLTEIRSPRGFILATQLENGSWHHAFIPKQID